MGGRPAGGPFLGYNPRDPVRMPPPATGDGIEYVSRAEEYWFPDEWYQLADAQHFWLRWRFAALRRQLRRLGLALDAPLRVLDVGGGTGVVRQQLESVSSWVIDITDLHPAALHAAKRGRGRNLCYNIRDERPGLVDSYDVVLLFDVLEHIDQTRPFVASLVRHLRPGGHLFLNVPALRALTSAYDVAAGHLRRYDRASLAAEFAGSPIEVRDLAYWGMSMVPILGLRKLVAALRPRQTPAEIIRAGFCPPGALADRVLRGLMAVELALLPRPPLGSSLLLAGRKGGG
jgi:2-polyprenyl-3-methyl-5-hydroxy-6-metoxy-1,4-benzoquinol methylase